MQGMEARTASAKNLFMVIVPKANEFPDKDRILKLRKMSRGRMESGMETFARDRVRVGKRLNFGDA